MSQVISNHHFIEGESFGAGGFSLLDHNEDYMLFKVDENVTAIGTTPLSFSEDTDEALVVVTAEMEVVSLIELNEGNFWDATINENNRIAISGSAFGSGNSLINQTTEINGSRFLMSMDLEGNIIWLKDDIELLSGISNFVEIAEDNSVYYTGGVIANLEEESFSFAGEEFLSTATDLQFPFNTITLKFSPTGEELWGSIISGNDFNRPQDIAIGEDGRVTISGIHDDEYLDINGIEYYGSGSFIVTYDTNGEELWHYFQSNHEPWEIQSSNFSQINYIGSDLTTALYVTGDSLFLNDQVLLPYCITNNFGLFVRFNELGETVYLEDFGNQGGSSRTESVLYNEELYIIISSALPEVTINCETYEFPEDMWEVYIYKINGNGESEIVFKYQSPMMSSFDLIRDYNLAKIGDKFFVKTMYFGTLQANNFEISSGEFSQSVILELSDVNSVSENKLESGFSVYPNPTLEELNFSVSNDIKNKGYTIEIYDILGKKILRESNVEKLNISIMSKGCYYVHLLSDGYHSTQKIIKE